MNTTNNLRVGTQVLYIPQHADGFVTHPDSEFGFIVDIPVEDATYVFCRFFSNDILDTMVPKTTEEFYAALRTYQNAELVETDRLKAIDLFYQEDIEDLMRYLGYNIERTEI